MSINFYMYIIYFLFINFLLFINLIEEMLFLTIKSKRIVLNLRPAYS